jgi:translation initiation factor IF-2
VGLRNAVTAFPKEYAPGEFMQQRRVRLGDILDDYCPRERRITNHAVVAMIDDQVKQTRCTTCQSDHEYKGAKIPPARRKKSGALTGEAEGVIRPRPAASLDDEPDVPDETMPSNDPVDTIEEMDALPSESPAEPAATEERGEGVTADEAEGDSGAESSSEQDEWPVHRPLIRATLPRPEGQTPERKAPDFTFRPGGSGGRFDSNRNGKRHRGGPRPMRHGQGQQGQGGQGQGPRQGAGPGQRPRPGAGPGGQPGPRHGNRQGPGGGGSRPGQGRGPRQGSGPGRKRGR